MQINDHLYMTELSMRGLVQQSEGGGPNAMVLTSDLQRPAPGPGEYLIRVSAAGVNFADVMQTHGTYAGGPEAPYIAGFEAAGEIVDVGTGVESPLGAGVHVVGMGRGAFAQYMTMPAARVLPVPTGWKDAEALGMELNWGTALAALVPLGEVRAGTVVLIHAAAGGVGQAAVRLARHYGARVIATSSSSKLDTVRALGADEVLDSRHPRLTEEIMRLTGGVDLVLESVGRATFDISLSVIKPFSGRIVVFGAASGDASLTTHDLVFTHQVQVKGLHIGALAATAPSIYQDLMTEIQRLIAEGVYRPRMPHIHALSEGPAVLEDVGAGRTSGKHALDPWLSIPGVPAGRLSAVNPAQR